MTARLPRVVDDPLTREADPHARAAPITTLRDAMRRARFDNAEQAHALADLHSARTVRLALLRDALAPLIKQIPPDIEDFDIGLSIGSRPRLFIDMICFVETGRDAKVYRLLQNRRAGQKVLAETDDITTMVDAITDYVARRLLDREKALDATERDTSVATQVRASESPVRSRPFLWVGIAIAFLVDVLGTLVLLALVAAGAWTIWLHVRP